MRVCQQNRVFHQIYRQLKFFVFLKKNKSNLNNYYFDYFIFTNILEATTGTKTTDVTTTLITKTTTIIINVSRMTEQITTEISITDESLSTKQGISLVL
jgi:hypothetical protein